MHNSETKKSFPVCNQMFFKELPFSIMYSGVGQFGVPAGLITLRSEVQILPPLFFFGVTFIYLISFRQEMKKEGVNIWKVVLLTILGMFLFFFVVLPVFVLMSLGSSIPTAGNVALIPLEGVILGTQASLLGSSVVSSSDIVEFIMQAEDDSQIKAIVLQINSPGGSAVASDEIATAVKNAKKPVVAVIREVGASGGYWVASAADYVVANRMSITGSIGVISSYLEFSGLMEEYGVGYERLVAGDNKDIGTPFRKLTSKEKIILQKKLDTIHSYFIEEVAQNRDLPVDQVRKAATGEFYLGVEALSLGLVDELGDLSSVERYLHQQGITDVEYVPYQRQPTFLDALTSVLSGFSFSIGEGIGHRLSQPNPILLS